jgi:zinc transporter, ZIP family
MSEAFFWGLLGGSSLVIGAVVVFVHEPARRPLGLIMGFGAGVLLSAISFELVSEALTVEEGQGGTALGFFFGALVFYLGDTAIARLGRTRQGKDEESSGLSIVLGTVLDGVPESAVLGLTLLHTGSIGISMLVAIFLSNLPEAISASSGLLHTGWRRSQVLALWSGVAGVSALSAAAGYGLLADASPRTLAFVLAFAGGAILTMLATTMIPEAYEKAHRPVGLVTTLGFAVALSISLLEV